MSACRRQRPPQAGKRITLIVPTVPKTPASYPAEANGPGLGDGTRETFVSVTPVTDEELVTRAQAGDQESFNQLVVRWERPIYALAYRTLGREDDARDVVQEAFLRAFRGLKGFKGEAKFSSWLYRITLNLCRDWIRRER